jgi:hypothetical protein
MRVSAARSSWSRERLSSAIALGAVSRATPARYFSSTSITPNFASEPPASADVMPAGMFAPSAFDTTGPAARRASAISRVVVVLPFVAETSTTSRCCASRPSSSGSSLSATLPPITDPLPRPAARDTAAAALPAVTASLARGVSGSELPDIVLDPPCVRRRACPRHRLVESAYRDPPLSPNRGTTPDPGLAMTVPLRPCDTARSRAPPGAYDP